MKDLVPARALGLTLAAPQLVIGTWAVLAPRGWFDHFPGIGPALAAAEPPYNQHLVTDAGAGFLAVGSVLAVACLAGGRAELRLAAIGYLVFGLPHLVYHAANPSPLLPAFNDGLNVVLLGAEAVAAATLLALTIDRRIDRKKVPAWAS